MKNGKQSALAALILLAALLCAACGKSQETSIDYGSSEL